MNDKVLTALGVGIAASLSDACSECGSPIHPERRAALPRALTCSRKCSVDRARKRRQAASRAAHRKRFRRTQKEENP